MITPVTKEIICLTCPTGCHIQVTVGDGDLIVEGNECPRGEEYAREEFREPKRVVTATCRALSAGVQRLPVRTTGPVAMEHIDELLGLIYSLELSPPMAAGDVVITDFRGVQVIITANLDSNGPGLN